MYDKSSVLRVETTINDPHELKILKQVDGKDGEVMRWVKMGKSISNLYRYAQVCKASNTRYLDAVALAVPTGEIIEELDKLCSRTIFKDKDYTGFNALSPETCNIFLAVMNGANHINGFTNKDIRIQLFPSADADDKTVRNKTTRTLSKLRAHKLISKVPYSFKYKASKKGIKIMTAILRIKHKEFPYCADV